MCNNSIKFKLQLFDLFIKLIFRISSILINPHIR